MSRKEVKRQMQIVRSIYRASTDKFEAYKKVICTYYQHAEYDRKLSPYIVRFYNEYIFNK